MRFVSQELVPPPQLTCVVSATMFVRMHIALLGLLLHAAPLTAKSVATVLKDPVRGCSSTEVPSSKAPLLTVTVPSAGLYLISVDAQIPNMAPYAGAVRIRQRGAVTCHRRLATLTQRLEAGNVEFFVDGQRFDGTASITPQPLEPGALSVSLVNITPPVVTLEGPLSHNPLSIVTRPLNVSSEEPALILDVKGTRTMRVGAMGTWVSIKVAGAEVNASPRGDEVTLSGRVEMRIPRLPPGVADADGSVRIVLEDPHAPADLPGISSLPTMPLAARAPPQALGLTVAAQRPVALCGGMTFGSLPEGFITVERPLSPVFIRARLPGLHGQLLLEGPFGSDGHPLDRGAPKDAEGRTSDLWTAARHECVSLGMNSGRPLSLEPGRYLVRLGLPEKTASPGLVAVRVEGAGDVQTPPLTTVGVPPADAPILWRGVTQYMPFFPEEPSPDELQQLFSNADPGHLVWPTLDLGGDVARSVPAMTGALYPRKDEPLMVLRVSTDVTVASSDGLVFTVPEKYLTTRSPAAPVFPTVPRNVVIPSFDVASRWVGPAEEKKVAAHNLKRARALECSATFEDAKLGGIRGRSLQWFRTTYVNGKAQKVEDYNEVVRGQAWQKCGLGRLESDEAKLVAALEIAFRKRAAQALTKVMTRFPGATPFDPFKDSPETTRPRPAAHPAP